MFKWLVILTLFAGTCQLFGIYDSARINGLYDSIWYYYDKEDYQKSMYYSHAIIKIEGISDFKKLKNVYNNLCVISYNLGRFTEAVKYGKLSLIVSDDIKFNANVYINLGNTYAEHGDFITAIIYYNNALNCDTANNTLKSMVFNNIGYAYSKVKKWDKAKIFYLKSIKIKEEYKIKDFSYVYYNCALSCYYTGDNKSSEYYFHKSINSCAETFGTKSSETAMAYLNYGFFQAKLGFYKNAIGNLNIAEIFFLNTIGIKHIYTALCYMYMGEMYMQKGEYEKALHFFQFALVSKIDNFNSINVFDNPSSNVKPDIKLIELLNFKSQAYENYFKQTSEIKYLEYAFKTLELNLKYIEKLRIDLLTEYTKLTLSSNECDVYMALIRISNDLYLETKDANYFYKAFEYSERSKYGILREVKNDLYARSFAGVPDSITEKEQQLKAEITSLQLKFEKDQNNKILNNQLFSLINQKELLIEKIENGYQKYQKAKYENKVASPDEIRSKLKKNQALIEYTIDDSTLYIFTFTKDTFFLLTRKADTSFYANLKQYTGYLHSHYSEEYESWRKPSYYLYKELILPVEKYLKGKELIIVPDKLLGKIAFECLTTQPYKENTFHMYQREPYLLYKYPMGYTFSATLLTKHGDIKERRKTFAGFAPEYGNSADTLPAMPETMSSIKKIAFLFMGRYFVSEKATKENVKENAGNHRILHFYAHGQEDTLNASMSKMFLAGDSGCLYSHEISNMQVNSDLVVLMACYSGAGNISEGEGIMSLGRSFYNAGATSAVISLWRTSTYHSMDIITSFYKNLLRGKSKAQALQLAKIKFLEKASPIGADPQNWASIIITGNQDPMFRFYFVKLLLLPALFLVIIMFFIRKKLNKL